MLDERWVFYDKVKPEDQGNGVVRRVLAYSKDLMCVENTFEKGAVGALHHHPHTQITYIVSGEFEFDKATGADIVASYSEDDDFLGLAINAPDNGFIVFAETVHDCCEE